MNQYLCPLITIFTVGIHILIQPTIHADTKGSPLPESFKHPVPTIDLTDKSWDGHAICYSGYREGQSPQTGIAPTQEQILEDLNIIQNNWNIIRIYGADDYAVDVLSVIKEHDINLKVQLGIWLAGEKFTDLNLDSNREQIQKGIALANAYPDIVVGVCVGNETLVSWTFQPIPLNAMIDYVKEVKAAVKQPVTVADNWEVWQSEDGAKLAQYLDYITLHCYAIWDAQAGPSGIDTAIEYLEQQIERTQQNIPHKQIVVGETGWATFAPDDLIYNRIGSQGNEKNQHTYFQQLLSWSKEKSITVFYFSAFDEPWKGKATEGYWGLFTEKRQAKSVMDKYYPHLATDEPTSPTYDAWNFPERLNIAEAFRDSVVRHMQIKGFFNTANVATATAIKTENDKSAISLTLTQQDYGGCYGAFIAPLDTTAHKNIVFKLKLPKDTSYLELKLDGGSEAGINIIDYISQPQNGWVTATIPLNKYPRDLNGELKEIGFWHPKDSQGKYIQTAITISDIYFTR